MQLPLALRLALREMRAGTKGFRIFLACLALGVGAIATVQTIAGDIMQSLRDNGRGLLGADLTIEQLYQPFTDEQITAFTAAGTIARTAELRGMARNSAGSESSLVEFKAVEEAYPLYDALVIEGGGNGQALMARAASPQGERWGALVEAPLLRRLNMNVGDTLRLGDLDYIVRGVIEKEPDRAAGGTFTLGPRVMVAYASLPETGLVQPGSLIQYHALVRLDNTSEAPRDVIARWNAQFPDAQWRTQTYDNASPQIRRFVERLSLFLTLVGLTALLVGGVGISNAVQSHIDSKLATIATLKCLGAPAALIFQTYFWQVFLLSLIGIALGLGIGVLMPVGLGPLAAQYLPIPVELSLTPSGLLVAAAFGLLSALAFSLWPLGRAQETPAATLFRSTITPLTARPKPIYLIGVALAGLGLAGLALSLNENRNFAAGFLVGAVLSIIAFRLAASLAVAVARRLGRPKRPDLRLGVTNLYRPGAPTVGVVLSLGLGLTVLVAIALVEGNFAKQVRDSLPENAPSFFFIDIQPDQKDAFDETVRSVPGVREVNKVPSLRGRITAVNGVPAADALKDPRQRWVLAGDRGFTYQAEKPAGDRFLAGEWWPADYSGPPLVSVGDQIASAFGIGPGDTLTVTILGRDITATVANVRQIDWGTLSINFTMVFSPGVLEAAPQTWIATTRSTTEAESQIQDAVMSRFANITAIRVKEALETVNQLLSQIGGAVRLTAAVSLLAGVLVLAGAIAAGHRRRVYDAVVLKVLGATRPDMLRAFLVEYGLLGLLAAGLSAAIGTLVAWSVLTQVMEVPWTFIPSAVITVVLIAGTITLAFGFLGTWRALSQKPAPLLRNE